MKDNLWMNEWLRNPEVWEHIDTVDRTVCHIKTPRSADTWYGRSCPQAEWFLKKEFHRKYFAEYYDNKEYWQPQFLCDKHYHEYILPEPEPVYPELEALHELLKVIHGE